MVRTGMAKLERAKFGSKIGIILATAGSAVGLGNVWRFPYMTGQNGGAVFIMIYIGCVLLLGIPCMISEFIIGRHAQANTARAFKKIGGRIPLSYIGYMSVLTCFLITSYYAVVSGWCLQYISASLAGRMSGGSPEFFASYFTNFMQDPVKPVFWTFIVLGITALVVIHGVRDGIEKASKVMMPVLFILLLIIVGASCMLPDAYKGIEFLFKPDYKMINGEVFLSALGQSFYSMSIAMGCICTYASYFSKHTNLTSSAVQIGVIDTIVAILAGLMIFPAAFSVGVNPDSCPSLIFITLPNVFQQAFGSIPALCYAISLTFFTLLSMAALTSLISLLEVCTAFCQEEFRITRRKAAVAVTVMCILTGTLCSLSLGPTGTMFHFFEEPLFDIFDFVTGQIFLPVVGFLTCILIGWFVPHKMVRDEFTNNGTLRVSHLFHVYIFLIKYVCPIAILWIFLHQLELI
jgi:NSS family neurotransmitter:Na+ symporter